MEPNADAHRLTASPVWVERICLTPFKLPVPESADARKDAFLAELAGQLQACDTHIENFVRVPERCRHLDQGMAALISDLEIRGLLDDTLVVLTTEFGRTPRINANVGRDHFPRVFSAALAGGGVKSQKYGMSDEGGVNVVENPVSHADFNATIGYALGLPLDQALYSPTKRPFTVARNGRPITKLFA